MVSLRESLVAILRSSIQHGVTVENKVPGNNNIHKCSQTPLKWMLQISALKTEENYYRPSDSSVLRLTHSGTSLPKIACCQVKGQVTAVYSD